MGRGRPQPELHFDEKELKTDLGHGNFIFVGSSCDMWAKGIPRESISRILDHCNPGNQYLFQSKNPARFNDFVIPKYAILGTTIESNRCCCDFQPGAPCTSERYLAMRDIVIRPKMVSIEPIMDFDLDVMVRWMQEIKPQFISIGANTNWKVKLPEPSSDKVKALIEALKDITEIKCKSNLNRLLKGQYGH